MTGGSFSRVLTRVVRTIVAAAAWLACTALPLAAADPVVIHFFWGDGCPHCAEAKPFLEDLTRRTPRSELRAYEIWYDPENAALFEAMAAAKGFEAVAVPTIVVGDRHWIGYSAGIATQIDSAVQACLRDGCADGEAEPAQPVPEPPRVEPVDVPFIGTIDLGSMSLWLSTAVIAFVDGFNPCSLWVLSMLVALTLHTGSRRKVLLVGVTFITVTAGVYALFIAGLFTVLSVVGFAAWARIAVALVALLFGAINVKDYFFFKQGVSLTIAEGDKQQIYAGMRRVTTAGESTWGLIGATVILAVGVSLVEFSCTAGFPVLWSNLLAAEAVPPVTFILLLLLYLVIYQLDELAIFLAAVFTLRANRFQEAQGRVLKLIGGVLMLTLAMVMIVDPALMNRIGTTFFIFMAAFAATGLLILVHRVILPRFGIWIGSEKTSGRQVPPSS
ncbi:MAG: hypothetical protein GY798_33620 [Hyphomicrobiales bacterium]|nr:hypothetical protein [Hyphomicrobiales bacterium]